ncbi:MAG: hypothetical protein ACTSQF_01825 [Candidatus Heimdallarchaeaceae archaeon]
MSLEIPYGVKVINPKPLNHYYDNDGTPYTTVSAANSAIPIGVRYYGLTCNVNTIEYWYKDGLTDPDLVVKPLDLFYQHNQQVPSSSWSVTHNLGKYPSVTVIDSVDNEVIGDMEYTDANNLVINFTSTFSGKAYMN